MKPKITLFHCINTISDGGILTGLVENSMQLQVVKLACSGMVKDVYLLRAFEAGSDAVVVLVCDESSCRYTEGSIRARKRVEYVRGLIEEIGMDGGRLSVFNLPAGDEKAAAKLVDGEAAKIIELEKEKLKIGVKT